MLVVFFVVRALGSVHDRDKFILYVAELACWHCALLVWIFNSTRALDLDRLANTSFGTVHRGFCAGLKPFVIQHCVFFCCHASNMSRLKKVTSTHDNGRVCVSHVVIPVVDACFPLTQLVLMAMNRGERRGDHSALWSVWSESCDGEMSVPNTFVTCESFFFFLLLLCKIFAKTEVTCRDDGLIMCHNKLLSWTLSFLFVSSPLWMVNILSNVSGWNHMETQACTRPAARGFKVLVQKTCIAPVQSITDTRRS